MWWILIAFVVVGVVVYVTHKTLVTFHKVIEAEENGSTRQGAPEPTMTTPPIPEGEPFISDANGKLIPVRIVGRIPGEFVLRRKDGEGGDFIVSSSKVTFRRTP